MVLSLSGHISPRRRVIERALELRWQIIDLHHYEDAVPRGMVPDGALLDQQWSEPLPRRLRQLGCPAVRVALSPHPRDGVYPAVAADKPAAGRLAAEHFAERSFRHVGFVGYQPLSVYKALYESLRARAVELGCEAHLFAFPPLPAHVAPKQKPGLRRRQLQAWLTQVPKPIGVLGFSAEMGGRICVSSLAAGLQVPEDVAIVVCDDEPLACKSAPVPLSAIENCWDREGEQAVELLRELMAGKPPPAGTVFVTPREVVVRQSTDVLATTDPVVARAVRYLWDHLDRDLSVDDVAAVAGVNRRRLERAFHAQFGRGVHAELLRRRLERLCVLLRATDRSIRDLACDVGFRSTEYLHTCFRRAIGTTPLQYRKRYAAGQPRRVTRGGPAEEPQPQPRGATRILG